MPWRSQSRPRSDPEAVSRRASEMRRGAAYSRDAGRVLSARSGQPLPDPDSSRSDEAICDRFA